MNTNQKEKNQHILYRILKKQGRTVSWLSKEINISANHLYRVFRKEKPMSEKLENKIIEAIL